MIALLSLAILAMWNPTPSSRSLPLIQGSRSQQTTAKQSPAAKPQTGPIPTPVPPFGISQRFQGLAIAIENKLATKDFTGAKDLMAQMPRQRLAILWDDAAVPSSLRTEYRKARDNAVKNFIAGMPLDVVVSSPTDPLSHKLSRAPDIKFEFSPKLATPDGASEPLGIAVFFTDPTSTAPFDAVIGLKIGQPLKYKTPIEINNDVGFAMSQYFGMAQSPIIGSFAYHVDSPSGYPNSGIRIDHLVLQQNIDLMATLQNAITEKRQIFPASSKLFIDPEKVEVNQQTIEGDRIDIGFQITNTGSGPLQMQLIPDCSCFSPQDAQPVAAGQSIVYHVAMDTTHYRGDVHKELYLLTNDPDRPAMTIPVDLKITPRYQIFTPNGTSLVANGDSVDTSIYMTTDGGPMKIVGATISGYQGHVQVAPWKGFLGDPPVSNKDAHPLSGYKFTIHCGPGVLLGRSMYTLNIATTDATFPTINSTFFVQRGVEVVPGSVALGDLPGGSTSVNLVLDSAVNPFKILSMSCDIPHFKMKLLTSAYGKTIKVSLVYDGLAVAGPVQGKITIHTNLPNQKLIVVPVQGTIE